MNSIAAGRNSSAMTDQPTKKPYIHVVYEYGVDYRPHSSPFLRLIRPFGYPRVQAYVDATLDIRYHGLPADSGGGAADLVIVDRLWRPDVSLENVTALVDSIHQSGARLVYSLDDNFFDLVAENKGWPPREFLPIVAYLLRQAHGVMVSTEPLRQRLLEFNPNILTLPNQLDERLLVGRHPSQLTTDALRPPSPLSPQGRGAGGEGRPLTIGYMGTFTHDEDLLMILPALQAVFRRHPGQLELQIVGVARSDETKAALQDLPVRYVYPRPEEHEYPMFMLWFTANVRWDIAISPLRDTPFTRCKSDIKFLDYAAIGAAGIYSRGPAYDSTVQHKETGWLAENDPAAWEEALETLLTDPDLRLHLAQSATRYLHTERTLAQRAPDWVEAVRGWMK